MSDLPHVAQFRISKMKGDDGEPPIFTSDLSVNEFLMVKQGGFDPLGLVMGCSVYHVGYQFIFAGLFGAAWQDKELTVATQATYNARMLAMNRMMEEAEALGADGITGVRFHLPRYDWGTSLLHVTVIGTAIKRRDGKNFRGPGNRPFTSNLSGQDFWTLLQSGHRPYSLVMGNCVYALRHQGIMQQLKQIGQNAEVANYTQALYQARELAQARMLAEVKAKEAQGVTGVQLEEAAHPHPDPSEGAPQYYTLDYFSIGTAVLPVDEAAPLSIPELVQPMDS